MILYTVQAPEVVDILLKKGIVFPDKSREHDSWRPAYDWLRSKMIERDLIRDMSCSMFWAFDETNIEEAQYYSGVMITLDIHESLLLPSEYYDWHSVLNKGPILHETNDERDFDRKYDCITNRGISAIKQTWDLCLGDFEDSRIVPRRKYDHQPLWQYTFAYICKDCVKDIQPNQKGK